MGGGGDFSNKLNKINFQSKFIRNCAEHALRGNVVETILSTKADMLVLDLADERIPKLLISWNGGEVRIARHVFFNNLRDYFKNEKYFCNEIRFNALPWENVKMAYQNFVQKITDKAGGFQQKNIIIVEVYMATEFINENYKICRYDVDNSAFSKEYIRDVNDYLKKCYTYLESLLPDSKIIKIPENILTPYYNRWGLNPLHYTSEVYEYLLKCINIFTGQSNENSISALYEELKFKNYIIRQVLKGSE